MDWSKFTIMRIWIYLYLILNDHRIHKDFSPASRKFVNSFLCLGQKLQFLCGFTIILNFNCQQVYGNFCEFVKILFKIQHKVDCYSIRYDKPASLTFISSCVFRETKTCIIFVIGLD